MRPALTLATFCAVLGGLALAAPVAAGVEEGVAEFRRGNFLHALSELRGPAAAGDPVAAYHLAVMYHHGLGVPADFAKALALYRSAAEQNHVDAQIGLGVMHAAGQGTPRDPAEAWLWLALAAERLPPGEDRTRVLAHRDALAAAMTEAERTEAERRRRDWRPTTP